MTEIKDTEERTAIKEEQIAYIRNHSEDPFQMILEKLQGQVRIVGLGEVHRELKMEQFANSIIDRAAKQKLISFLALEIGIDKQPDLEVFMRTGIVSDKLQKEILNHHKNEYKQILETARKRNLSVICVVDDITNQDDFMKREILNYLKDYPGKKGIFYAGNAHIAKLDNFMGKEDLLASELGESYYSVFQIQERSKVTDPGMYDSTFGSAIAKPIGIDNVSQTPLSKATFDFHHGDLSEYGQLTDALVILPAVKWKDLV